MDFIHYLYGKFPNLKRQMLTAHMRVSPQDFIKRNFVNSSIYALFISFIGFMLINKMLEDSSFNNPFFILLILFLIFPFVFTYIFVLLLKSPVVIIKRRRKDIDKDVLFAGRYLLVKLNSGKPLLNSLIDASKTYGVGAKYFKEIVDNITLGMPIEDAIDRAMTLSPSHFFQKVLFQISNSIRLGVDITGTLSQVLDDIIDEQMTEIETYSSKLNSVALFYMILATVVPSLGLSMFVVVAVMIGFEIQTIVYIILWMSIVGLQFLFLMIFKGIRPNINF